MKISDVTCPSCGASYEMAEATSVKGKPGQAKCVMCGELLESWQEPKLKAFRLVMAVEHRYANVPALSALEAPSMVSSADDAHTYARSKMFAPD